ncbi:MAG TPA: septal ring lytic transglycosylase RlpA family protein [Thermoanaerobaculia bacterium]|nr:septal ring lytic transglycosylase RlpA family protein [Thermoanaerobaculia bacterium]
MRSRVAALALIVVLAYGCATSSQPQEPRPSETLQGVASWYGEEFAGRTTANGEIFDPSLLTAAHRTLPFGTVLDVTNAKTSQSVRVRVNDRGPYIGGRVIDLSYAAAKQIGLIEPGIGEVIFRIVKVGSGEREPPAPFDVTIAEAPKTAPVVSAGDAPAIDFPLPAAPVVAPTPEPAVVAQVPTVVVDRVDVETQRGDVITRKQVGSDGRTLEDVPIAKGEATSASSLDAQRRPAAAPRRTTSALKQFLVQVGAFSVEANAKSLQERLTAIGHRSFIERDALYRVRIGPFTTRDQAVAARTSLEANGISAMIVTE